MNILIIHGDHTIKSYERFQELIKKSKEKGWEIIRVSADEKFNISERLSSRSLFASKLLFVLDDYKKITVKDFSFFNKNNDRLDGFLVVYSGSALSKTALNKLPKGYKTEEFIIPKLIWKFFESIYPNNAKLCINLLREVIKKEPVEFIFHLLARHLRDLYWVSIDPKGIGYQPWRVNKLKNQASRFRPGILEKFIKSLAELDVKVKTSQENLTQALDFVIASHLE